MFTKNNFFGFVVIAIILVLLLSGLASRTKTTKQPITNSQPEDIRIDAYLRCVDGLPWFQLGTSAQTHCFELAKKTQ